MTKEAADLRRIEASTEQIEHYAGALLQALLPGSPHGDSWKEPAGWLYDKLVRPVEGSLNGVTHLVVVGDGILREIPFETLLDGLPDSGATGRLLIERFTVSYAPSATVLDRVSRERDRPEWAYDYWGFASTRFRSSDAKEASDPHPQRGWGTRSADQQGNSGAPRDAIADVLRSARRLDLPPLPNAGLEVKQIAGKFPEARRRVYIDYEGNGRTAKEVVLSASDSGALTSVRYLHFATHTILDFNRPLDAGLALSPPLFDEGTEPASHGTEVGTSAKDGWPSSPGGGGANSPVLRALAPGEIAGPRSKNVGRHGDARASVPHPQRGWGTRAKPAAASGILSLREIASLDLGCELVVLSSCHGLGGAPVDGDWLNGLTRSFFVAGSNNVVCTLWEVADTHALRIMPAFYRALRLDISASPSPARALRTVKLALLRSPMLRHPSNWAGFVCYGR